MPNETKDSGSLFNFIKDKNIDFEKEYREYKLYDEKFFDFEYLDYKFRIVLYMSLLISSIFFIMLGAFLWTITIIRDLSILLIILFFFGYISFIGLFLIRRERARFKRILSKMYEQKFI